MSSIIYDLSSDRVIISERKKKQQKTFEPQSQNAPSNMYDLRRFRPDVLSDLCLHWAHMQEGLHFSGHDRNPFSREPGHSYLRYPLLLKLNTFIFNFLKVTYKLHLSSSAFLECSTVFGFGYVHQFTILIWQNGQQCGSRGGGSSWALSPGPTMLA